ncbi:hypothetical protein ABZP36_013183 [Zizania latifolia]
MATHRHTAKEIALSADSAERRSTFHWKTLPHGADWVHAKRLRLMSSLHMVNVRSSTEINKEKCELVRPMHAAAAAAAALPVMGPGYNYCDGHCELFCFFSSSLFPVVY